MFMLFALCGQLHSIALAMRRSPAECLRRFKSLKVFALRKCVRDAGEGAFEGCEALETLKVEEEDEEGLLKLGDSCLKGCRALKKVQLAAACFSSSPR